MKSLGEEIKSRGVSCFTTPDDCIFTLYISEYIDKTCGVYIDDSLIGHINYKSSFTYALKKGKTVKVYDIDGNAVHFNACFTPFI